MGCEMNELIQKSVRLPVELIVFIEAQEGRDFSKKLINLLHEVREGDAERQETLQEYEKMIRFSRRDLDELRHKIYNANEILRRLSSLLSYADGMMEKNKPEEPEN